eukprot:CAMPEP_0170314942 /NCGR_PEP_ID=MMETSP0116_2-20130129/58057_1 /TAXON_ID=400756 /ORGANISM="Durinskia baltica, Strain CSIRO CS-38" /LENGTH=114 /DNA_ID=CAMNT_0010567417 /DNA_START=209 /DNA_END=549 /DNA_ORIENTATION=+
MRLVAPAIKFAGEEDLFGVRHPLAVCDPRLVAIEPKCLVALRELSETALFVLELLLPPVVPIHAVPNLPLHTLEGAVKLKNLQSHVNLLAVNGQRMAKRCRRQRQGFGGRLCQT